MRFKVFYIVTTLYKNDSSLTEGILFLQVVLNANCSGRTVEPAIKPTCYEVDFHDLFLHFPRWSVSTDATIDEV